MGVKDNPLSLLSHCHAHIRVSLINDVELLGPAPAKHFNKVRGVIRALEPREAQPWLPLSSIAANNTWPIPRKPNF